MIWLYNYRILAYYGILGNLYDHERAADPRTWRLPSVTS